MESGAPRSLWHGDSLLVFDSSGTTSQFSSTDFQALISSYSLVTTSWNAGDPLSARLLEGEESNCGRASCQQQHFRLL